MDARQAIITRYYRALDQQDLAALAATLHADADFPDQLEGGRRQGRDAVRDYWAGAFSILRGDSAPMDFKALPDGDMEVTVHHHVTGREGGFWFEGPVVYRFAFLDGLIARMDQVKSL